MTSSLAIGMGKAAGSVGINIISSLIFEVGKHLLSNSTKTKDNFTISKIVEKVKATFEEKYSSLYDSGAFVGFINNPIFKDIIENYVLYKSTGESWTIIYKLRSKRDDIVGEKEIVEYLTDNLLLEYEKTTVLPPGRGLVENFFEEYFKVAVECLFSGLDEQERVQIFFVNRRIDNATTSIIERFDELVDVLKRSIKGDTVSVTDAYEESVEEYKKILKENNSRAHIYLLDKFDFSKFYVPPILVRQSPEDIPFYLENLYEDLRDKTFDDWKYIFKNSNIVYVTGGAGYGKSLFLKKLINDYKEIDSLNSQEYLVIYGDLKQFYTEGDEPIPVVNFLQNCMVKETLMSHEKFPVEMIEYYLKMGRCLILLDALDEVEKHKREDLHKKIIGFFKTQNPNNKVCITSRDRGFIPEKDIVAFNISPLTYNQIETYVDNIIELKRFEAGEKSEFLTQAEKLIEKGFLNSFLVLSLLLSIYKAENELPENKIELYQKCFEYIANRRERDKIRVRIDWDLISCMMKDNTFMELAQMCFPNNSEVGKEEIIEMLCKTYYGKHSSEAETERAAEHFLSFCSDRTELFVPATGEDRYKFFHRSFYEYFYAQYIFTRIHSVDEEYNVLQKFDVDSEVFELTLAMIKQKDEERYKELLDYIFSKVDEEFSEASNSKSISFNILTLLMQVVDDDIYIRRYFDYLISHVKLFSKKANGISNHGIIYELVKENKEYVSKVVAAYKDKAEWEIVKLVYNELLDRDDEFYNTRLKKGKAALIRGIISQKFVWLCNNFFFLKLYVNEHGLKKMGDYFSKDKLEKLMLKCKVQKSTRKKYLEKCDIYNAFGRTWKKLMRDLITQNPYTYKIDEDWEPY